MTDCASIGYGETRKEILRTVETHAKDNRGKIEVVVTCQAPKIQLILKYLMG